MTLFISNGNGKRHHTPLPVRPRKIKITSREAISYIKEILGKLKLPRTNTRRQRHKKIKTSKKHSVDIIQKTYVPTMIGNTRDSLFWRWRRVNDWEHYINDPAENKKGHKNHGIILFPY